MCKTNLQSNLILIVSQFVTVVQFHGHFTNHFENSRLNNVGVDSYFYTTQ